ncbi:hypothetical protein FS837_007965, partial [Tulasnella sp. UAMH 9824]
MTKLYGKKAADPDWPESGTSRAGKIQYSIVDGSKLKVEGSTENDGLYTLKQNADTIVQMVEMLNDTQHRRAQEALDAYDDALCRYLLAILRRVSGFYKTSKWALVKKTLSDFESREAGGFKHDPAGRLEWKAWMEKEKDIPPEPRVEKEKDIPSEASMGRDVTSEPRNADLSSMRSSGQDTTPASPTGTSPLWEENYGPFPDLIDEQDASLPVFEVAAAEDEASPRKVLADTLQQLQLDRRKKLLPPGTPSKSKSPSNRPPWAKPISGMPSDNKLEHNSAQQSQLPEASLVGPDSGELEPEIASVGLEAQASHYKEQSTTPPTPPSLPTKQKGKQKEDQPLPSQSKEVMSDKQQPVENALGINIDVLEPMADSSTLETKDIQAKKGQDVTAQIKQKSRPKAVGLGNQTSRKASKRVAMLSVDEDGLASGDIAPPAKRLKTKSSQGEGLAHMLWDVLNEQKNISLGNGAM